MSGLWPLRVAIFACFIVNVGSESNCGPGECQFHDCCVHNKYGDYGWSPLVRCTDIAEYLSTFQVIVNETQPRIELPLLFRPPNDSVKCWADGPLEQTIHPWLLHPMYNYCFDLPDCKEMPVIEFGTESCKVQVTIGCGNHSAENPIMCDYNDPDNRKYKQRSVYRINGLEFLSFGLGYNATTGYLTPNCNPSAKPGCDKPIPCDFDPDADGYAHDFYVELKNKPGCVTELIFDGCPGIVPVKVNATEVQ